EEPPAEETEPEQARQHDERDRAEAVQGVRAVDDEPPRGMHVIERTVGYVAQNDCPDRHEHQDAGEHEEAGVAQGELEANAQAEGSMHALSQALYLAAFRCGSRRRSRWR